MEVNEIELIDALECAQAYLEEDIQALAYFQDEYFAFTEIQKNFSYRYKEMQNTLQVLFKSMCLNKNQIKQAVDEAYERRRKEKGITVS